MAVSLTVLRFFINHLAMNNSRELIPVTVRLSSPIVEQVKNLSSRKNMTITEVFEKAIQRILEEELSLSGRDANPPGQ